MDHPRPRPPSPPARQPALCLTESLQSAFDGLWPSAVWLEPLLDRLERRS